MKPQIPWLRVFVEGVVIVGSILLAFGIEAAWEERGRSVQEAEQLRALRSDLAANLARLDTLLMDQVVPVEAQRQALRVIHGAVPVPKTDSLAVLLSRSLFFYRFKPIMGAYDALVSSGDIDLLQSDELRGELAAWVGAVGDGYEDEDLSTLYRVELTRAISKHVDVLALYEPSQIGYLGLETIERPTSLSDLIVDTEFSSLLSGLAFTEANIHAYFEHLASGVRHVIELIDRESRR